MSLVFASNSKTVKLHLNAPCTSLAETFRWLKFRGNASWERMVGIYKASKLLSQIEDTLTENATLPSEMNSLILQKCDIECEEMGFSNCKKYSALELVLEYVSQQRKRFRTCDCCEVYLYKREKRAYLSTVFGDEYHDWVKQVVNFKSCCSILYWYSYAGQIF